MRSWSTFRIGLKCLPIIYCLQCTNFSCLMFYVSIKVNNLLDHMWYCSRSLHNCLFCRNVRQKRTFGKVANCWFFGENPRCYYRCSHNSKFSTLHQPLVWCMLFVCFPRSIALVQLEQHVVTLLLPITVLGIGQPSHQRKPINLSKLRKRVRY